MRQLVFIILLAITVAVRGQTNLSGRVTDGSDGSVLPGVSVRLLDSGGKIKRFATGRADGTFSIAVPQHYSGLRVQFARMGYGTEVFSLDSLSLADSLHVAMPVEAVELREVGVRAKRIRENGDTVTYNVGQFSRAQDRSIGEVMNRMPGLEVDNNGKVQYQGTDINRLYVEGNDVAGSSYGVVTKNLQAEHVGAVEVLENHQPLQVLRGLSYSDQAAVNLKLKEKSKTSIMGHGSGGGGWGDRTGGLYTGDLFLMSVRGALQNITSFKVNNLGSPLGSFAGGIAFDGEGERLYSYIDIGGVAGTGRTLLNRSAAFSTNVTWKNRRGGQWRVRAEYGYDHLWADRSTVTTYFTEQGDRVVTEDRHADSHEHKATLAANYEVNEKRFYLYDNLTANLSWTDTDIDITGTMPNRQLAHTPFHDVTNRLKVIRRYGERHIVTFNSILEWMTGPGRLKVEADGRQYGTDLTQHAFFTDERASYGFVIGRVVATVEGGVSAYLRHLDTQIQGLDEYDYSNDFSTDYLRLFVQPKFEMNLRRVSLKFGVPLNWYSYFFGGSLDNRSELFAAPELTVQWKPNSRQTFNFSASARRSPATLSQILRNPVLSDYRTFNAGVDDYYTSTGQALGAHWEWRNARRGLFANVSASQRWNKQQCGVAQTLAGDYIFNYYRSAPSKTESTDIYGRVQKSVDMLNSSFSVSASAQRGTSTVYSDGNPVDRSHARFSVTPGLDMAFCSFLNGDYRFNFNRSSMTLKGLSRESYDNYRHSFGLAFTPGKWIVRVQGTHERTETRPHEYDNRLDLSAHLTIKLSRKVDLDFNASNLLDRRRRVTRSLGDLFMTETVSMQRGRQFLLSVRVTR